MTNQRLDSFHLSKRRFEVHLNRQLGCSCYPCHARTHVRIWKHVGDTSKKSKETEGKKWKHEPISWWKTLQFPMQLRLKFCQIGFFFFGYATTENCFSTAACKTGSQEQYINYNVTIVPLIKNRELNQVFSFWKRMEDELRLICKTAFTSRKTSSKRFGARTQVSRKWLGFLRKCFAQMFGRIVLCKRKESKDTWQYINLIASKHIKKDRKGLTCGWQ